MKRSNNSSTGSVWSEASPVALPQSLTNASAPIPNRFVFVWSGRHFPYYCRLAVESALLADHGAEVSLATFGERPTGEPHFEAVARYQRVAVETVDLAACFSGLDAPAQAWLDLLATIPASAHSARSNLVRYGLLHQRGGIYLDFDVLLVRDFRHLLHHSAFVGEERVWRVDEARVEGQIRPWMAVPTLAYLLAYGLRWTDARMLGGSRLTEPVARLLDPIWSAPNLNNAVIGAAPGNSFLRRVLSAALAASPTIRYHLGPTLISRVYRESAEGVVRLPPDVFFSEPPSYSFRFFRGRPRALSEDAVLIHFVSSNHARLLNRLDVEAVADPGRRGLFYALARRVVQGANGLPRKAEFSGAGV